LNPVEFPLQPVIFLTVKKADPDGGIQAHCLILDRIEELKVIPSQVN
jgi:hypothetical protein